MSKSNELYMTTQQSPEDLDYQYFVWMSDKEWQEYLDEEEKRYHTKYGYGVAFMLKWSEFLIKNNLKNNLK